MGVYVLQEEDNGYIKIGFTTGDPKARLAKLQTGNPRKLQLICHYEAGKKSDEKVLHTYLNSYRINGEWFRPSRVVDEVIAALKKDCYLAFMASLDLNKWFTRYLKDRGRKKAKPDDLQDFSGESIRIFRKRIRDKFSIPHKSSIKTKVTRTKRKRKKVTR